MLLLMFGSHTVKKTIKTSLEKSLNELNFKADGGKKEMEGAVPAVEMINESDKLRSLLNVLIPSNTI